MSQPFLAGGTGMRDLDTLGRNYSCGFAINDVRQVTGWPETTSGHNHGFITGRDGMGMRDLGTLGETEIFNQSLAYGINDAAPRAAHRNILDQISAYLVSRTTPMSVAANPRIGCLEKHDKRQWPNLDKVYATPLIVCLLLITFVTN